MKAIRQTMQLDKGLAPVADPPPNGKWLTQGQGVRMGLGGLELAPTPTDPLGVSTMWPWPQLVNLRREIIAVQADGLYAVADDWSLSQILSSSSADSVLWQFADYGTYWYATNGSDVYLRDVDGGTVSQVSYSDFPQFGSMVAFKGQVVGCALNSAWKDADSRFAVWSNIGQNTFLPDWKNEAGWRDLEIGVTWRCLALGDQAIVFYGSEGVAMLSPASNTYAYTHVSKMPPLSKNAMGGSKEHVYINSEGKLIKLSSEGKETMGFEHLLGAMDSDLLRVLEDPVRGDIYITDDTTCYILANGQLTEAALLPTSLCAVDGELVGHYETVSQDILVTLQKQDMNLVGLKSVEFLELGVQTDGEVWGGLDFHYELSQVSRDLGWLPVNDSGFVYLGATANQFQPKVQVIAPSNFRLPYLTYGVKVTDNRIQNQLQTMSDGSWDAS